MTHTVSSSFSEFQPNTYTFTKSLSEQIIQEKQDVLPMIIFRPSIVISSISEPMPGWIDNYNGPVGLLVGCGFGINRWSGGYGGHVRSECLISIPLLF